MAALMVVQSASMSQGVTFTPTVARREPCPRLVGGCLVARRSSGGSAAPPLVWTRAPSSSIGSLPVWTDVASRIGSGGSAGSTVRFRTFLARPFPGISGLCATSGVTSGLLSWTEQRALL